MKEIKEDGLLVDFELYNYFSSDLKDLENLKKIDSLYFLFGGSLRDIVSGEPKKIKDLDIVCSRIASAQIENMLISNGWYMDEEDSILSEEYQIAYRERIIKMPLNYYKNNCIIQLITPVYGYRRYGPRTLDLDNFIANVDMTCSGLAYRFDDGALYEIIDGAHKNCIDKIIIPQEYARMYHPSKFSKRQKKLEKRGWKLYESISYQ